MVELIRAVDNFIDAYRKKYRLARGGIRENAPCREEFAQLAVAFNDIQTAHLKAPPPQPTADVPLTKEADNGNA